MKIVSREQWGARPPASAWDILDPAQLRGVALHYSAMDADEQADHRTCAARVRAIQDFHLDGRGWKDIAYNFVVCKHGYVFLGRGWGRRSGANGTNDANTRYHAVCFLGDDTPNRDDVTAEGRVALLQLVARALERYPAARELRPHSDFTPTACPGDELRTWLGRVRAVL